jgi:hypothetical protein
MERLPKTKAEIEQLVLAEMQTFADCEHALEVVVVPIVEQGEQATWTVSCFNPGKSDGEACHFALHAIVPRFQRAYDMVQKH